MATDYASQIKKYQDILKKSPTAYTAGIKPTAKDVSTQVSMLEAKKASEVAKGAALQSEWYPEDIPQKEGKNVLQRGLHAFATPFYAVTGAVESALGKGTKRGLLSNIASNIEEEGTMGDLIRSYGTNNMVAMPLGFALDIALDPVNWLTMGTSAIIPRTAVGIGKGLAKEGVTGAIKGAGTAIKSGVLGSLENTGRAVPGLVKKAFPETGEAIGKTANMYNKLSQQSDIARKAWDELVNTKMDDVLQKSITGKRFGAKIGEQLEKTPKGKVVKEFMTYSPSDWYEQAKEEAKLGEGILGVSGRPRTSYSGVDESAEFANRYNNKLTMEKQLNDAVGIMENPNLGRVSSSDRVVGALRGESILQSQMAQYVVDEVKKIKDVYLAGDNRSLKSLGNLLGQVKINEAGEVVEGMNAWKQLKDVANVFDYYQVGLKDYDTKIAKIVSSKNARNFLKGYADFIGLFKFAKIGGNLLVASTNAIAGNLTMTAMHGIDITNAGFYKMAKNAVGIIKGDANALKSLTENKEWMKYMTDYPEPFKKIFGMNPEALLNARPFIQNLEKINPNVPIEAWDDLNKTVGNLLKVKGEEIIRPATSITGAALQGEQSSFLVGEVLQGPFGDFINQIKNLGWIESVDNNGRKILKEIDGSRALAARIWYKAATVPMEAYSKVDQTYKLGLALHLTENGLGADELKLLAKRIPIGSTDVIKQEGRNVYKLKPDIATKIVSEVYMNYLAMPGFVKMMRTLPVIGAPFGSFSYAMTAQGLKNGLYNLSFFNKIQYLLKEISGRKSPLEKQSLASPYYNWYTNEGMVKIPFFQDNPVYLNVANMIPYYQMNFFQSSDRSYKKRFGDKVARVLDKLPIMKDPSGQIMFDYIMLPLMIQGDQPQGAFGQPLWRENAKLPEKIGRASMAAVETVMPPMAGYAGLAVPEKVAGWIPNYRARQLAYAKAGKSVLGIPTKENPTEKTARIMSALAGWPVYSMKLTYKKPK